ncbi:hypothetical protein DRO31_05280, partial [Candidatus Bathyarchaeota archaeon]
MGLFSGLKRRWEIKNKKLELEQKTLELEYEIMKDSLKTLNELEEVRYAKTDDYRYTMGRKDTRWVDIDSDTGEGVQLSETDLETLRNQSRLMWEKDPLANNIIESSVDFVTGRGVSISLAKLDTEVFKSEVEREEIKKKVNEYWNTFKEVNGFDDMVPEFSRRAFRDGEFFIRWFMPVGRPFSIEEAVPQIRFIEPERIKDPNGQISYGIKVSDDDYRKIEYYCVCNDDQTGYEPVPPDEIFHVKVRADSNCKRGRAILFPVLMHLKYYQQWLKYRIILNKIRTAVVMIRSVKGSPQAVAAIRSGQQATTTAKTTKAQSLEPGTVITAQEGIEYKFMSPQLDARDAGSDGREIKLAIAAGVGFPEMLITSDFSNNTYSSSLTAQNPMIRKFQSWQEFFGRFYKKVFAKVIQCGIDHWELPDNTPKKATVEFAPMIHRELKNEVE